MKSKEDFISSQTDNLSIMDVGHKIKKIRELKNLKQEYVAQKVGLSTTAYGNIERGATDLPFSRLEQIANILDVELNDIINFPESYHIGKIKNSQVGSGSYYDNRKNFENDIMKKLILVLDKLTEKL